MEDIGERYLEKRIRTEIEVLNVHINELEQERRALERQLLKIRANISDIKDVNRRNSVNRILIENKIIDTISKSDKDITSKFIYREVTKVFPSLKANTFRSYMLRLKNRKAIQAAEKNGVWSKPTPPDPKAA